MRRAGGAWAAVLVCVATAGCLTRSDGPLGPPRVSKTGDRVQARSIDPTVPAGGLYVNSILLERPVGDPFLDRTLWATDPAQVPPPTKALLTENGLRVVVLGGNLPPEFQKLLDSQTDVVNPQSLTFANRKDAVLPTAGPTDPCEYTVLPGLAAERTRVKLRQARCGVLVRPEVTPGGRVKVWCEPQVQHGDRQDWIRPTADATGFVVQGEVPLERYPELGFEVVLGAKEYLVIGWPAEAADTVGAALFGVEANGRLRQRVLVIRAGYRGDVPSDLPAIPNLRGRPSIAAEAARW
ncbi:MAG: hypothetical protein JWO38_5446 [Gemmataceae bacterium]|nr:hypothetical protein [Gemmataceae bacterium]